MIRIASTRWPVRRWQFRLRTLLAFVTLASAATALTTWWVALPLRTWQNFSARIEAGDVDGANAYCDLAVTRIAPDGTMPGYPAKGPQVERALMQQIITYATPRPRTWRDVVEGSLHFDTPEGYGTYWTDLRVEQGRVRFTNALVEY
jgi:hypothetical protein